MVRSSPAPTHLGPPQPIPEPDVGARLELAEGADDANERASRFVRDNTWHEMFEQRANHAELGHASTRTNSQRSWAASTRAKLRGKSKNALLRMPSGNPNGGYARLVDESPVVRPETKHSHLKDIPPLPTGEVDLNLHIRYLVDVEQPMPRPYLGFGVDARNIVTVVHADRDDLQVRVGGGNQAPQCAAVRGVCMLYAMCGASVCTGNACVLELCAHASSVHACLWPQHAAALG